MQVRILPSAYSVLVGTRVSREKNKRDSGMLVLVWTLSYLA